MAEKVTRFNKVLRELNISLERAVDFLKEKGHEVEASPNTKITESIYNVLSDEFSLDKDKKSASKEVGEEKRKEKEALKEEREKENEERLKKDEALKTEKEEVIRAKASLTGTKQVGKIDLNTIGKPKGKTVVEEVPAEKIVEKVIKTEPAKTVETTKHEFKIVTPAPKPVEKVTTPEPIVTEPEVADDNIETKYQKLSGPKVTGQTIDLSQFNKPKKKKEDTTTAGAGAGAKNKKKRKRITNAPGTTNSTTSTATPTGNNNFKKSGNNFKKGGKQPIAKVEPNEVDVQKQVRETLEKLQGKGSKSKASKYRKDKRDTHRQKTDDEQRQLDSESRILKVTEFVTVGEVAILMDVQITDVIKVCMSLGIMVTMNQRLDAETLSIVADEFDFEIEFIKTDIDDTGKEEIIDDPADLITRAPIVTVMGHVDHGKTSLLDHIRDENVIAGESGGITQHIGAYSVTLNNGKKITFLDTPGHEAFTAMRARGAQVTDIAIIVIAADDNIMPQTKEAISHAQAAGVQIIFAINKIDLPTANPEKIKESLAGMNLLVEDWGGKYQSQDISAKKGIGVRELLDKVLLEAELLDLKANPKRISNGTVVEAFLDKGRGYVSTILVQNGTLKIGDYVLAGHQHGKVKAMYDERGHNIKSAEPSTPVSILGLDGPPTAGDKFLVYEDEKEAKQTAAKRSRLTREQNVRTQRHITLDEIGRRIALGDFKELNIILKGDVDGSVEALSDSFMKLSTEEIQINIIHKGVGAITESDVLLASASDAIIIGFNVRPSGTSKQLAEKEEIDIRTYSIIYAAIDDLKDAMEGMLSPVMKEEITGSAEIRETFKISKIGTIAGCMVIDGKIYRSSQIRLIRDGIVLYTGDLASLKRFKDDVKEVSKGYDCGMQVKNYNDIQVGDILESFREVEVKKKL